MLGREHVYAGGKGDIVHAIELKYPEIKSSVVLLESEYIKGPVIVVSVVDSSPSTPGETGASVAFFIVS